MPRKRTQKATPAVIERLERTAHAIELRKSGATFAMIGDRFGVSAQSAHEMVMKGLRATLAEPAAELRALAVARLDQMLNAIWTAATNGDLQAQAGVLRLEERRAKLLELDAPKQIEDVRDVSGRQGEPAGEVEQDCQIASYPRCFSLTLARSANSTVWECQRAH